MFSSNQILEISGCLSDAEELKRALEFALSSADYLKAFTNVTKVDCKCVFQLTKDGRYCIGYAYNKPETGWIEYPFDFDLSIISQIIVKHLDKQEIQYGQWDGSYHKGFKMKAIEGSFAEEANGIMHPWYGIVEFEPYTCFYAK